VLAVEPSLTMRAQRPAHAAPAIAARAEELLLDDGVEHIPTPSTVTCATRKRLTVRCGS
jgi:hypothetical protein